MKKIKLFFVSMFSTFLVLIFFMGIIIVDKNTRKVAFGDNTPILVVEKEKDKPKKININLFGKHIEIKTAF